MLGYSPAVPADQTTATELGSAEANRLFYEEHAADYDETEFCAIDKMPRDLLRGQLKRGLELAGTSPSILDAGGGTGNASLLLHEMGHESTLVDASPEMIARYEEKARRAELEPDSEIADLEAFFDSDERRWDLIVFSSVLHHLEHPGEALVGAAGRLRAGGAIVTIFDPLAVDGVGQFMRKLDYGLWIAIHSPSTLARALARRLPHRSRREGTEVNVAAIAERHAMTGLDDGALRARVEAAGLQTFHHDRLYDARYRWIVSASRRLGQATHFSFVFRRPQDED